MTKEEFMKYASHANNLSQEEIAALDWDQISQLPAQAAIIQESLLLWSQFIVGNIAETAKKIQQMSGSDRKSVLKTWIDITKDEQQMRHIAIFVTEMLAK